ncbi:MAG: aminotransferase class V-fold PLP-dependent enzyme [Pseudomonadota bacterium]|uniref:aminotransferase class V-fold PLP-dependent enzyme n=1 Tax=Gallaecimonas pentaromativorans TaxID=584787 RepID=UPI00067E735A|nr:aminotransferase class V-fold PLP-dependent enzyme [Gallaecimonas pentaromativorans]MED5525832.1 aminotransferase class V-fold PLP-dependent enzyme [Pseudomonadota bacterium]
MGALTPSGIDEVYLDTNATTPVLPEAVAAVEEVMRALYGNPSSTHITGLKARHLMESTRQLARQVLGASNGHLIFTSGATEGIQTAVVSALSSVKNQPELLNRPGKLLLYGATEHKAVPNTLKHWNQLLGIDAEVMAIPVNHQGLLDLDFIRRHAKDALMICTMAVNNETGARQDLSAVEEAIRSQNPQCLWMVDCVQALGKMPLALSDTSIDYAPFSGHKLYAMKGIGLLYVRQKAPFSPFIAGGGQEQGLRSGTENLPGIASLKPILEALLDPAHSTFRSVDTLNGFRAQLADALLTAFPGLVFNNDFSVSVPTTLNFSVKGFASKELLDLFDAANIRVSSGSACSSGATRSFVLDAMGLPAWQSEAAIRLSFGPAMTQAQLDHACERIAKASDALRYSCRHPGHLKPTEQLEGLVQLKSGADCCYLLVSQGQAIVIDPVSPLVERLVETISCQGLQVAAILDTHGHADHLSAAPVLAERLGLASSDVDALGWPQQASTGPLGLPAIAVGDNWLSRMATPGHTSDAVALLLSKGEDIQAAFVGDTVLHGGLGRTDFESSDAKALYRSLKALGQQLPAKALLLPAHDYHNLLFTSLEAERRSNPLLAQVLAPVSMLDEAAFADQKTRLDQALDTPMEGCEIRCGVTNLNLKLSAEQELTLDDLALLDTPLLVDVRESHEHHLQHLGNDASAPLSRLAQYLLEHPEDKPLVCYCRSGSRSQVAAAALTRLGRRAYHLKGGVALSQ